MLFDNVLSQVAKIAQSIVKNVETRFKAWTEPSSDSMIGGVTADLVKNKQQVILENAFLRQQVIVLKRQIARPQLTAKDRYLLGKRQISERGLDQGRLIEYAFALNSQGCRTDELSPLSLKQDAPIPEANPFRLSDFLLPQLQNHVQRAHRHAVQ